jgi:hypothetical protein
MASVQQAAPPALQPTIAALKTFQAALLAFGVTQGLTVDSGTTSPLYIPYLKATNLASILLATLSSSQSTKTAEKQGGSLYELAAQFYQDITQAFAIMYANGFCTPWIPNAVVVNPNLPPKQTLTPSYGISGAQVTPSNE